MRQPEDTAALITSRKVNNSGKKEPGSLIESTAFTVLPKRWREPASAQRFHQQNSIFRLDIQNQKTITWLFPKKISLNNQTDNFNYGFSLKATKFAGFPSMDKQNQLGLTETVILNSCKVTTCTGTDIRCLQM